MPFAAPQSSDTRELVERFHVCWDVWPEYTYVNHEKRQIGFELDLSGTHGSGEAPPEPSREKCREVYRSLVRIAEDVFPRTNREITHQFEPYDQGIHYSPRRGNRPEVILRVRIIHRNAFERPIDAAQSHYLEELHRRLEEWGISQH